MITNNQIAKKKITKKNAPILTCTVIKIIDFLQFLKKNVQ